MSSGSILPTFGAAPPNIRRAIIPRELQPDLPNAADALRRPREPIVQEDNTSGRSSDEQSPFGRPIGSEGATALAVQESEEGKPLAPPRPPAAPTPSVASQRVARSADAAAEPDDDVNAQGLTEEEQAYVRELQAIDREVRSHEAAHAAVGGAYAGRPTYEYVTGPDGIRYAVSGRVQIDTGTVAGDPEATIRKLETVRRSALAPAKPSGQDRAVAAQAEAGIREAQAELNDQRSEAVEERPRGDANADQDPAGTRSFATNLAAQEAFSQAALNQAANFAETQGGQPRNGVNLIA